MQLPRRRQPRRTAPRTARTATRTLTAAAAQALAAAPRPTTAAPLTARPPPSAAAGAPPRPPRMWSCRVRLHAQSPGMSKSPGRRQTGARRWPCLCDEQPAAARDLPASACSVWLFSHQQPVTHSGLSRHENGHGSGSRREEERRHDQAHRSRSRHDEEPRPQSDRCAARAQPLQLLGTGWVILQCHLLRLRRALAAAQGRAQRAQEEQRRAQPQGGRGRALRSRQAQQGRARAKGRGRQGL